MQYVIRRPFAIILPDVFRYFLSLVASNRGMLLMISRNLLLALMLIMLLLSCGKRVKMHEGKTVFRYNESSGITSLDPAYAKNLANIWACNQLFNGLVELDDKLRIRPAIAESWKILDSGRIYIFKLRNDVFFHDHPLLGDSSMRRVKASDFVYSFKRIQDDKLASPGAWVFQYIDRQKGDNGFMDLNDTTLIVYLERPYPPFLGILTTKYCSVVPCEIVEHYGRDFRQNPVGTGPFYFKYWKEGVKMVFRKNDAYFEKDSLGNRLPYVDAVAISFLLDKQSVFLEFIKGNLDYLSGIDPGYKDELLTGDGKLNPKYKDNINLITEPYLNTEYLGILVEKRKPEENNPLLSREVRKAINYGFDRRKMIRYLRNNVGIPGNYGIIPVGMPAFDSAKIEGYSYDPEKARSMLDAAGYPEGVPLPPITLSTTAEYLDMCQFIQHQLSESGIELNIEVNPPATLKELKAQAKLDFFRASWVADYPDAENYLSLFYSPNFSPGGPNYTHFSDPVFDSLYERSLAETNDSLRYLIYSEMDNYMMSFSPVIILYYDQVLRFTRKTVSGLGSNPINLLDLREVKVGEAK